MFAFNAQVGKADLRNAIDLLSNAKLRSVPTSSPIGAGQSRTDWLLAFPVVVLRKCVWRSGQCF